MRDHERPLADKGRQGVVKVADSFVSKGWTVDWAVSSTAKRAVETGRLFLHCLQTPCELTLENALYLSAPEEILRQIQSVPDITSSLLLVGHNPGFGVVADACCGATGLPCAMKPGTAAIFQVDIDSWIDFRPALCRPDAFLKIDMGA